MRTSFTAVSAFLGLLACAAPSPGVASPAIRYVGSSTVAHVLRDAEPVYGRARFEIDTSPESEGGEKAIVTGRTDLAGIADRPRAETLRAGVASALIGRDAIAVIVNAKNPVTRISLPDLRAIFTGKMTSWSDLGGPDLPIRPFVVGIGSATRSVFRATVLREDQYGGCREIRPDQAMLKSVAADPGGIGQISFSFLDRDPGLRALAVDGEEPSATNFDYPIARPLYLLWREGKPDVESFVTWIQTKEGQEVVMKRFVGIRVVGSVRPMEGGPARGTLTVYTETYPVYDGGIHYYPHRPYKLLTRHGALIRRVENHRGENDENPEKVQLLPDTYLIRTGSSGGETVEFFVTIRAGQVTEFYVEERLRKRR